MRDILFKAKRIDNDEWAEGHYYSQVYYKDTIEEGYYHFIKPIGSESWENVSIDPFTLCQYTGLTDKNGNKIWENDIVLIDKIDKAVVIFSEKHSGYILQPIGDFYFDSPMLIHNVGIIDNIIGNTFDNAELLEGGVK